MKNRIPIRAMLMAAVVINMASVPTSGSAQIMTRGYPADTEKREVTVDVSKPVGQYRPLQGVNGTPSPQSKIRSRVTFIGAGEKGFHAEELMRPKGVDISAAYRAMGIDMVRIHDFIGAGDIDTRPSTFTKMMMSDGSILPSTPAEAAALRLDVMFPDMDADPNDPKSYNFGPTDRIIKSIIDINAQVFFRVGRGGPATDGTPPSDVGKYAAIVANVVRHYNQGWAGGFRYNIRHWEIWNEPDIFIPGHDAFWTGTPEQYYELYGALAKAIKGVDKTLLVGGPTLAFPVIDSPYREGFLKHVKKNKLPLDFFSWHLYSGQLANDPLTFSDYARFARSLLDSHGFKGTQSILSEWNYGYGSAKTLDAGERAAFLASASIYMQDAPLDKAILYRADAFVGKDGATLDKSGQALALIARLRDTPERLAVTGADDMGFAVAAGRSTDGKLIQLIVSNFETRDKCDLNFLAGMLGKTGDAISGVRCRTLVYQKNQGYDLKLGGLTSGEHWTMERYRLGYGLDTELIERREISGPVTISALMPPPGVDFIVLRRK